MVLGVYDVLMSSGIRDMPYSVSLCPVIPLASRIVVASFFPSYFVRSVLPMECCALGVRRFLGTFLGAPVTRWSNHCVRVGCNIGIVIRPSQVMFVPLNLKPLWLPSRSRLMLGR